MESFIKDGIKIIKVEDQNEGDDFAKDFLYKNSDPKTVIFLSGGKTPKSLYDQILLENKLSAGAFAMTDERYGDIGHGGSNALMMKYLPAGRQGFSPFYPILEGKSLDQTAKDYDKKIRYLFARFQKSIGILGIGSDGHTAGIPAIPEITRGILKDKKSFVKFYDESSYHILIYDVGKKYGKRVTMTFNAIANLTQIIIMVFGKEKEEALRLMFAPGKIEEIPARFYKEPEIAQKTILITDQKV